MSSYLTWRQKLKVPYTVKNKVKYPYFILYIVALVAIFAIITLPIIAFNNRW